LPCLEKAGDAAVTALDAAYDNLNNTAANATATTIAGLIAAAEAARMTFVHATATTPEALAATIVAANKSFVEATEAALEGLQAIVGPANQTFLNAVDVISAALVRAGKQSDKAIDDVLSNAPDSEQDALLDAMLKTDDAGNVTATRVTDAMDAGGASGVLAGQRRRAQIFETAFGEQAAIFNAVNDTFARVIGTNNAASAAAVAAVAAAVGQPAKTFIDAAEAKMAVLDALPDDESSPTTSFAVIENAIVGAATDRFADVLNAARSAMKPPSAKAKGKMGKGKTGKMGKTAPTPATP